MAAMKYIEKGQLTPDDKTSQMFLAHLSAQPDAGDCLLEGYPRTISQVRDFEGHINQRHRSLGSVIYLQVSRDELIRRVIARRICQTCGAIYNLLTRPPKQPAVCDFDGSALIQRADDLPAVAPSRVALYEEKEKHVLAYYRARGVLQSVNAEASLDIVLERVSTILGPLLVKPT